MCMFTIHQPTIFPSCYLVARWMMSDKLVLIGDAKTTVWSTQYWIYVNHRLQKFGVPIVKSEGDVSVNDAKFAKPLRMIEKLSKTFKQEHRKSPYLTRVLEDISLVEAYSTLGVYSEDMLRKLFRDLEAKTELIVVGELGVPNDFATPTERLVEIGKKIGGTCYYTAMDAPEKYLDVGVMERNGIEVKYQDFRFRNSVGLNARCSILDLLALYSFEDCAKALKGLGV